MIAAAPRRRVENERDNLLRQQVLSTLGSSGYVPLARLDCHVRDGVIELTGKVPSFYLKQMAQAVVAKVDNVRGVQNYVLVQ
jgi:osmotically-inducible protein OsmY